MIAVVGWVDVPDSDWGDFRRRRAVDISSYICVLSVSSNQWDLLFQMVFLANNDISFLIKGIICNRVWLCVVVISYLQHIVHIYKIKTESLVKDVLFSVDNLCAEHHF